ncbi:Alpha/beta hydrolase family protein [Roseovarius albus]|uniref:Alpha/beta hydrolase family protein n=1 Tax=Roseovarius albus TaxID=1247867 RepID=A0A1X6ZZA8_9RHOB|nr:alpha/beta hydrolase [Roseovarius albus]SLN66115.1 Alpha/beta hydrolase family protein [Roseovarius albus]
MNWDDAYANAPYIPGADDYPERWSTLARAFRAKMRKKGKVETSISYGDSKRQALDMFLPDTEPKGLVIFVHGGYWLKFHRTFWSHLAAGPLARGWVVAMPSYDLCPDVRIAEITQQIARAVDKAATLVHGPIILTGHSAGGHLVARMGTESMLPDNVTARIRHIVPISPVSDLRPLLNLTMNEDFKLDMAAAEAESPALMPAPNIPVTVWVGAEERPVFLDQARWLAEAWDAKHIVDPGLNHFNVIEGLMQASCPLTKALFN